MYRLGARARFSYDTRRLAAGDMFLALKSPKRDGHNFIEDVKEKGLPLPY